MRKIILSILILLISTASFSDNKVHFNTHNKLFYLTSKQRRILLSESKNRTQTYKNKMNHFKENLRKYGITLPADAPEELAKPFSQIDYSTVPQVSDYNQLYDIFLLIRDQRELLTDKMPNFTRRISWLYPLDGCYARAAVESHIMGEHHFIRGKKIFAFGNLSVQTKWLPSHLANWAWHVSVVIKLKGRGPYVLDPAIDAKEPLPVLRWFELMNDAHAKGVVCSTYAYASTDSCNKPEEGQASDEFGIADEENGYLNAEWDNIKKLGYNPKDLLGNNPPWKYH